MQRTVNDVLRRLEQHFAALQPTITMQRSATELQIKSNGRTHTIQRQRQRSSGSVRLR